jgi:hypothetical protein
LLAEFCLVNTRNLGFGFQIDRGGFESALARLKFTVAVVLTRFAGCPAFSRLNASAIEKHPASAAPISSSGFVPPPLSKRDKNEKGPSNAPLPSFIVPLPCFSVPSHTADPVLVAIVFTSYGCLFS